ncbi:hypothetical protein TrispH2_000529 [Trichoplax sp. H2]|nr:hypothetical protein TrispH2_000529 [Trichoplax sp. H2]|eukprot:RDD47723.1 hypothetical protein TrispH2_000529 [Trichoplax sp. H2]
MDKYQKNAVTDVWTELIKSMPPEHMSNRLIQKRILAIDDLEELKKCSTQNDKNTYILTIVMKCPDSNIFRIFIDALQSIETTANILAKKLEKAYQLQKDGQQQKMTADLIAEEDEWNEDDWLNCIQFVAKNLGKKWKMLGRRLHLTESQIIDCEENNRGNILEARTSMLLSWRDAWLDAAPSSKKGELIEALKKCDLNLIAHKVSQKQW